MATLNIELSKNGVDRVRAGSDTVSGSEELGKLITASALPLRLLNDAVVQYFDGSPATQDAENADEPEVFVPTDVDGEVDLPRKIAIQTGVLPRDTFDGPPDWFVASVQKMFPDYGWDEVGKPLSRELLLAFHSPEYIAQHKNTNAEELNELHNAPYCTPMEEAAVSVFSSHVSSNRLFDHWGWVGESLVSEPYGCTMENLKDLTVICDQLGWKFSIVGKSAHYPSATIRIEIQPKS